MKQKHTEHKLQAHAQAPQAAALHGAETWRWHRHLAATLQRWEREKLCKYFGLKRRKGEDKEAFNRRAQAVCPRRMRLARQDTIVEKGLKKLYRGVHAARRDKWERGTQSVGADN